MIYTEKQKTLRLLALMSNTYLFCSAYFIVVFIRQING